MKLNLAKFEIFWATVLDLSLMMWVRCQPLLSDRRQIDRIRLTLWQGVNLPPNRKVFLGLGEAIVLLQFWRNLIKD